MKKIDFQKADGIPKEALRKIEKLLNNGDLFRYLGDDKHVSESTLLEKDFAKFVGSKYALALNSCSSAIFLSLHACGAKLGDKVLMAGFTFTAVPSAVVHIGAKPVLVEVDENYRIDLEDLKRKISKDTKYLLLSHMRGHTSNLDEILKICKERNVCLIEDAAHSLGVKWGNKYVGTLGKVGCYSFQSHKMINGGEGGMLVTDDPEVIVKAVFLSGAYESMYKKHLIDLKLFEKYRNMFPVFNLRMNNISAIIVRSQLKGVNKKAKKYLSNYNYLAKILSKSKHIYLPAFNKKEHRAPDSIQFNLIGLSIEEAEECIKKAKSLGLQINVFGLDKMNARLFWNWGFVEEKTELPRTREILTFACDMRLPIFLTKSNLKEMGDTINKILSNV